jgi:RNA polymerase sigma factor (TIGR02999 family)
MDEDPDVTRLLARVGEGDEAAVAQLLSLVYKELRRIAGGIMKRERQNHTLQPTAVVHEAFARMLGGKPPQFESRAHFFGIAAHAMRNVLVDHARRRLAERRGGADQQQVELAEDLSLTPAQSEEVLAVNQALERLEKLDARQARIIEMHYFAGNTVPEIAVVLGVSERTVQRELKTGRLFLRQQLQHIGRN